MSLTFSAFWKGRGSLLLSTWTAQEYLWLWWRCSS